MYRQAGAGACARMRPPPAERARAALRQAQCGRLAASRWARVWASCEWAAALRWGAQWERQFGGETLGAPDYKLDGVNVRALGVGEPQPPAELDGEAVFVMRKPGFQADIGRAGEAVGYPVPRVSRKENSAEYRYGYKGCQERAQP